MAKSGSFQNGNINLGVRLEWNATQNYANLTSTITARLYRGHYNNNSPYTHSSPRKIRMGTVESETSASVNNSPNEWNLIHTFTRTIKHNTSTGKLSLELKGYFQKDYFGWTNEIGGNITLDDIPTTPNLYPKMATELFDVGPDYVKVRFISYSDYDTPQIRLWNAGAWGEWRTAVGNPVLLNRKDDNSYLNPSVVGYGVQMRFRHPTSGLFSECDPLYFDTLSNIYLVNYADFAVGNNIVNLNLYNPKSYKAKLYIKDKNNNLISTRENITSQNYSLELTEGEVNIICNTNTTTNNALYSIDVETRNLDNVVIGGIQNKQGLATITDGSPEMEMFSVEANDNATKTLMEWTDSVVLDNGKIIQNKTQVKLNLGTVVLKRGATFKKYKINASGNEYETTANNYIIAGGLSTNGNIIVTVEDSRGNTTSKSFPYVLIPYDNPYIASESADRLKFPNGETVNLKFNAKISSLMKTKGQYNIKYKYKKQTAASYSNLITLSPNSIDNDGNIIFDKTLVQVFESESVYNLVIYVNDYFNNSTIFKNIILNKESPEFWIGDNLISFLGLPPEGAENGAYFNTDNIKILKNGEYVSIFNIIYPIGSIYLSVNNVNPSTLFGGTWVHWGTGRVPVGVDTSQTEFNATEKTGGSKYLQRHIHTVATIYPFAFGGQRTAVANSNRDPGLGPTGTATDVVLEAGTGDSGNLQPYITCYMWKRTA